MAAHRIQICRRYQLRQMERGDGFGRYGFPTNAMQPLPKFNGTGSAEEVSVGGFLSSGQGSDAYILLNPVALYHTTSACIPPAASLSAGISQKDYQATYGAQQSIFPQASPLDSTAHDMNVDVTTEEEDLDMGGLEDTGMHGAIDESLNDFQSPQNINAHGIQFSGH